MSDQPKAPFPQAGPLNFVEADVLLALVTGAEELARQYVRDASPAELHAMAQRLHDGAQWLWAERKARLGAADPEAGAEPGGEVS